MNINNNNEITNGNNNKYQINYMAHKMAKSSHAIKKDS